MWKVLSQGIHMCNMKALSLLVWKLWPRLKFFKSRSNFKVKVTRKFDLLLKNFNLGHNFQTRSDRAFILHMCILCDKTFHMVPLFLMKGLVTRNTHVQYESPITSSLKVMTKVKVFVYAANADADADADADARAMTLAPRTFVPAR